jgi:hypothetical protein
MRLRELLHRPNGKHLKQYAVFMENAADPIDCLYAPPAWTTSGGGFRHAAVRIARPGRIRP